MSAPGGRLPGQVALVTGSGTGIGRCTALRLAAEGATVVLTGRRLAPLQAVAREIERAGGRAVARPADVARPSECRDLAAWTAAAVGPPDILVNNAGEASRIRNLRWLSEAEWDSVLAVNLTGVFALTQAVLEGMLARGRGTIVTVASLAALRSSLISGPAYGAAKAGVRNFMNYLQNTYRNQGIRATTICPAEVDTPILDKRPLPPDAAARRTMMQPEDVAEAILLCATLSPRTTIEEIVMSPTYLRDMTADLEFNRALGAPQGEPAWASPKAPARSS